jgi:antitoxin (DNA-binding transcriptional repressor) of toxin-antitoxin stability system
MKTASISETKNNLSALIAGLKGGSPVLIVDRGRPVARLEAVGSGDESGGRERLSRLIRSGLVRPRRGEPDLTLFTDPLPRPAPGISIVDMVVEERREGW